LKTSISWTVMSPLKTEEWGDNDGDEFTDEVTMASVPLEYTYASMEDSEANALSPGSTSGNVPRL